MFKCVQVYVCVCVCVRVCVCACEWSLSYPVRSVPSYGPLQLLGIPASGTQRLRPSGPRRRHRSSPSDPRGKPPRDLHKDPTRSPAAPASPLLQHTPSHVNIMISVCVCVNGEEFIHIFFLLFIALADCFLGIYWSLRAMKCLKITASRPLVCRKTESLLFIPTRLQWKNTRLSFILRLLAWLNTHTEQIIFMVSVYEFNEGP